VTTAQRVASIRQAVINAEQEQAHTEDPARRAELEALAVELRAVTEPQGEDVVCDALFHVDNAIDVCGTYATRYPDGSTLCHAGHVR
jgi:hypothetical protein